MTLHVAVSAWSWDGTPSGANRRLLGVLSALPELLGPGERVTVLHRPGARPEGLPADLESREVPLPARPSPWRALQEARLLPGVLRGLRPDLLDLGTLPVPADLPCAVCLTLHDLRDLDGFPRRPAWLSRRVLRTAVARAAGVVVPSRFTEDRLRAVAGDLLRSVTVVPGAADDAPPRVPASGDPGGGARGGPVAGDYLLHVGHLEARKNLGLLVQALREVPGGELWLAGADHGAAKGLRRLARRLGVARRVRFLGPVPDADLARLYAGARAVLVPSLYEGFGLAALEGLAHGRPVLVSDRGALPEVVGKAGTILPAGDPAAWARAMAARRGDSPGAAAARIVWARRFDWRRTAAATLGCWRQLAPQPRARTIAR